MLKGRPKKELMCSEEEIKQLNKFISSHSSQQRMVFRAKIILACLDKVKTNTEIAKELNTRISTISKWRNRFIKDRISGLEDEIRAGRIKTYDNNFRNLILDTLSNVKPPEGISQWDGKLIAKHLNVSARAVWRLLEKEGISLQRKRTWCISTDPQFQEKAADIVGLYLNPPINAIVISIDEKPNIQAIEREQGFIITNNKNIIRAEKSTYQFHGLQNIFAALEVHTGKVHGKVTDTKKRIDFLDFMNDLIKDLPDNKEYHVILDNYCTHKKNDEWLKLHTNVTFHYTPTSASWLNQIEIWFNIFTRKCLKNSSYSSTEELKNDIEKFIKYYNENNAHPFKWIKREVKGSQIRNTLKNLMKQSEDERKC